MLKQPDRIVIYPQRESNPDYLYCWIPPKYFGFVAGGSKKIEAELEDYYPMGIEAEFSQEGFYEYNLSLPAHYEIKALHEAYGELHKTGMLKKA